MYEPAPGGVAWTVPAVRIEDRPRFAWRSLLVDPARHFLSKREIEILRLIGTGADNVRIARKLSIAEQTVKNHVSVIYSKLHVHNRMQAMKLANSLKEYFGSES